MFKSTKAVHSTQAWFGQARFGMFIHWGLYSILGRGEWVMCRERIPKEEYAKLADRFNPRAFSPESWCIAAKKAGMKYMVMTTCHHDGFALFDSKADSFNSVKTAAKRDFVAEYVAASRKHGLGVGLYYSLGDWRFGIMKESDSAEGAAKMLALSHAQVRELTSNYGKIDILWYDGGWCYPSTPEDTMDDVRKFWRAETLNAMVRKLQPDILINNRSGTPEDFGTPEGHIDPPKNGGVWEACLTMGSDINSAWGYWHHNIDRKTRVQLISLLVTAASRGGNLLLNVSPDADGVIPGWQMENLKSIGDWMTDNSEAIYGVQRTTVTTDINGRQGNSAGICSEKGNILYFYMLEWPGRETVIPVMKRKIVNATLLKTGQKLACELDPGGRLILKGLPEHAIDPYCTVIKMEMDAQK